MNFKKKCGVKKSKSQKNSCNMCLRRVENWITLAILCLDINSYVIKLFKKKKARE